MWGSNPSCGCVLLQGQDCCHVASPTQRVGRVRIHPLQNCNHLPSEQTPPESLCSSSPRTWGGGIALPFLPRDSLHRPSQQNSHDAVLTSPELASPEEGHPDPGLSPPAAAAVPGPRAVGPRLRAAPFPAVHGVTPKPLAWPPWGEIAEKWPEYASFWDTGLPAPPQ